MSQEKTTKEKLLEEFDEKFIDDKYLSRTGMIPIYDTVLREKLINFLSQAINQTREETIMEVEEMLKEITPAYIGVLESNNDRRYYEYGWGELLGQIKQSLKSLINK